MTVGAPSVEREEGAQHAETYKRKREPDVLLLYVDSVGPVEVIGYVDDVHRLTAGTVEDAEDASHEERGATHQHEGQFHGGVFLLSATPYADEKVHRDECNLVEHEHGEHVYADEEAENAEAKQREPQEVFLGERLQFPRGECAGEHDDGRQQKHGNGDAVHTYGVADVQGLDPFDGVGIEHFCGRSGCTVAQIDDCQVSRQEQEGRAAGNHDRTDAFDALGQP